MLSGARCDRGVGNGFGHVQQMATQPAILPPRSLGFLVSTFLGLSTLSSLIRFLRPSLPVCRVNIGASGEIRLHWHWPCFTTTSKGHVCDYLPIGSRSRRNWQVSTWSQRTSRPTQVAVHSVSFELAGLYFQHRLSAEAGTGRPVSRVGQEREAVPSRGDSSRCVVVKCM